MRMTINNNTIIGICILIVMLGLSTIVVSGTTIDIYYPNNNTTTDIYYAENGDYNCTSNNTISGNFTMLMINDEIEYTDFISEPHKIISPIFKIVGVIILFTLIIILVILIKRLWKE